jgi:hypothetical protein
MPVLVQRSLAGCIHSDRGLFALEEPPIAKTFSVGAIDVITFDGDGMNTEHYGI